MFAGVDPTAAPPPHLPGSMGAIEAQKHAMAQARGPTQVGFQAYEDNGGTTIGVSGKDFAILGSDTRLSRGYSILCRDAPKSVQLTANCVLTSAGMKADRDMLHKVRTKARAAPKRRCVFRVIATPPMTKAAGRRSCAHPNWFTDAQDPPHHV